MISACLMVLDEEYWIRQCLNALRTYPVDEVIVVDGGSKDQTLEIIRKDYPEVKLFENPMPFSFSEQRNFVRDMASGDWILSIDADETLKGAELIPQFLDDENIIGLSIPTDHIGTVHTDADPHIRIFRNKTGLRWEREIHEYLSWYGTPLMAHPAHMGEQTVIRWTPEVVLQHWAYTAPEEKLRAKARRYMPYNDIGAGIQINSEDDLVPKCE